MAGTVINTAQTYAAAPGHALACPGGLRHQVRHGGGRVVGYEVAER